MILTFEAIPASEHELAVRLDDAPIVPRRDGRPAELPSTELSVRETTRSGWLTSLNDFAAATLWHGRKEIDGALAALGEAVSATAIAHVAWDGHDTPTVAAGAGDLSKLSEIIEPRALMPPKSADPTTDDIASFRPHGSKGLAAAVQRDGSVWRQALVMSGERLPFETTGLLELALRMLIAQESEPGKPDAVTTAPRTAELAFPDWHVKGHSPAMQALYRQLESFARSSSPVLVTGETGVGKEHIVRILHASSDRADGPLQVVNCAAIPSELLEAELFGIERGVATGVEKRKGRFARRCLKEAWIKVASRRTETG